MMRIALFVCAVFFVLALLALLANHYSDHLLAAVTEFLNLEKDNLELQNARLDAINGTLDLASKILGIPSFLFGGILLVYRYFNRSGAADQPHNPPQPPIDWQAARSASNPAGARDLDTYYYAALDTHCGAVPLHVIAEIERGKFDPKLWDIYEDQLIRLAEHRSERSDPFRQASEPLPLMTALDQLEGNRLVVEGGVGSGKTSFLKYLTHCVVASRNISTTLNLPSRLINRPVILVLLRAVGDQLKEAGESKKRQPGLLWRIMQAEVRRMTESGLNVQGEPPLSDAAFAGYWDEFRRRFREQGVLLIDGLDELSEASGRRGMVREAIKEFQEDAPNVFMVVTSRPYALELSEQRLSGFREGRLEPMREPQIRQFIRNWYRQAGPSAQLTESQIEERAAQLTEEIFARSYLPEMAEKPLLLTLFIGLDYSGTRLPASRAKLYEKAVDLLLQRWHSSLREYRQNLDDSDQHALQVIERAHDKLLSALENLAYQTYGKHRPDASAGGNQQASERIEFPLTDVLGHLCKELAAGPGMEPVRHEQIVHFLQFRSALLMAGLGDETFQFAHKSFHEYLAASALLKEGEWKSTVRELLTSNPDWWREVFLLVTKKYSDLAFGDAVLFLHHDLLCDLNIAASDPVQLRLLIVAATAALELGVHDKAASNRFCASLQNHLRESLVAAMTSIDLTLQERAEAGRLLSQLGDPRPGVTIQRDANGGMLTRVRNGKSHALPDLDWVPIPAGTLWMGSDGDEGYDWEKPAHAIDVPGFYISRAPITSAQFQCFIDTGGYEDRSVWRELPEAASRWLEGGLADAELLGGMEASLRESYRQWLDSDLDRRRPRFWRDRQWNLPNHPVVGASWYEALAYAQ